MKFESGKLVVLVGCGNPVLKEFLGHIKTLGGRSVLHSDSWYFDPMLIDAEGCRVSWHESQMRLIENPGDDAQDESLSWKKVPSTDKREELA